MFNKIPSLICIIVLFNQTICHHTPARTIASPKGEEMSIEINTKQSYVQLKVQRSYYTPSDTTLKKLLFQRSLQKSHSFKKLQSEDKGVD